MIEPTAARLGGPSTLIAAARFVEVFGADEAGGQDEHDSCRGFVAIGVGVNGAAGDEELFAAVEFVGLCHRWSRL